MGFLDTVLRKKESKDHNLGVCIPETYQKKMGKELQKKVFAGDPPVFKVTGTYEISPTAIIFGEVISGRIKPGAKFKHRGKEYEVSELQQSTRIVETLMAGSKGGILLSSDVAPIVKHGDIIDFSE